MSADPLGAAVKLLLPFDEPLGASPGRDYAPWGLPTTPISGSIVPTDQNRRFDRNTALFNNGYIQLPNSPQWTLYPDGCLEFDFFMANPAVNHNWVYCGQYGVNEPYSVIWLPGQGKFVSTQSFGTPFYSNVVSLAANTWYHLTLDGLGPEYCFRLNGTNIGYRNAGVSFPNQQSSLYIGGVNWDSSGRITGQMANLRLTRASRRSGTGDFLIETAPYPLPDQPGMTILRGKLTQFDWVDGGSWKITGTVARLGSPGPFRVRLFDKQSGRFIREVWADAQGRYSFPRIANRPNGYVAIAHDHSPTPVNAAVSDQLILEPMA